MTYMQKFRAWLMLSVLTFMSLSTIAFAADAAPINPNDTLASVRLSSITMQAIVSVFLPLIVGFVTNIKDSPFVKGALQLILNAVSALIVQTTLVDGSAAFSRQTIMVFVVGTATSLVAYYNVWKSKGITSSLVPVKTLDPVTNATTLAYLPGSLSTAGLRQAA